MPQNQKNKKISAEDFFNRILAEQSKTPASFTEYKSGKAIEDYNEVTPSVKIPEVRSVEPEEGMTTKIETIQESNDVALEKIQQVDSQLNNIAKEKIQAEGRYTDKVETKMGAEAKLSTNNTSVAEAYHYFVKEDLGSDKVESNQAAELEEIWDPLEN